ncbi:MAG: 30S ribosome-binding factor RbfA [Deltaproteobacteria bacterium]
MASLKIPHELGFSGGASKRPARVADAISRELAMFFIAGVKDPRLQGLVVTHAEVTKDLRRAIVYYACAEDKAKEIDRGLTSAKGFLRSHLAGALGLRFVPELIFRRDLAAERMAEIDRLLQEDVKPDDSQP